MKKLSTKKRLLPAFILPVLLFITGVSYAQTEISKARETTLQDLKRARFNDAQKQLEYLPELYRWNGQFAGLSEETRKIIEMELQGAPQQTAYGKPEKWNTAKNDSRHKPVDLLSVAATVAEDCPLPLWISPTPFSDQATVFWASVQEAQDYTVQYREVGQAGWNQQNASPSPIFNFLIITGLSPATDYEVQVRTNCASGSSDFSPSAFFTTFEAQVSSCTAGSTTLRSQEEVDAFGALGCSEVTGSIRLEDALVRIGWYSGSLITDLSPLSNLISIGQDLTITSSTTDLEGLSQLNSVGGDLTIASNPSLQNLSGLSQLNSVGGDLTIASNPSLQNLSGLSQLFTALSGWLKIEYNPSLTNLEALSDLSSVGGALVISGNSMLENLDELSNLTSIGLLAPVASLVIDRSDNLTNIDGLSNLTTIKSSIIIRYNPLLTNLEGLSNLTSIGGRLWLQSNNSLKNLEGLSGITEFSSPLPSFIISNSSLKNLQGLSALVSLAGSLRIEGNDALINLEGLSSLSSIEGDLDIISNSSLKNLQGLSALVSLAGSLRIEGNDALINLEGLSMLSSVAGNLYIASNPFLKNLEGLSSLSTVGGGLDIVFNSSLKNLQGLSNLTSAAEYLRIEGNDALINLEGLSMLSSVAGSLYIVSNPLLKKMGGLFSLSAIGGRLILDNNDALPNVDDLSSLTSVAEDLQIGNNASLQNLDGLSHLSSVGGDLVISSNPSLISCCGIYQLLCADPPNCSSNNVGGEVIVPAAVSLTIELDFFPEETTWEIRDAGNNILASGGPYTSEPPVSTVNEFIALPDGCFDLIMYDAFGDGICCDYGIGFYQLVDISDNSILASGGQFAFSEATSFCIDGQIASGCTEADIISGGPCLSPSLYALRDNTNLLDTYENIHELSVYPNPAREELMLDLKSFADGPATVQMINVLGKVLWQKQFQEIGEIVNITIDLKSVPSLESGLYFIRLSYEGAAFTRQVIIQE